MKELAWPLPHQYGSIHLGLERIIKFLEYLGNPQQHLRNVIHVAGTNGKGSITAFLKYMLQAAGYTVNRFTSPHLVHFNERIELAGTAISDAQLLYYLDKCRTELAHSGLELSYFESLTVAAFLAFADIDADYNIIEVGLGGRLDATNVFTHPLATIISTISLDHMHILGDNLIAIAKEKAGIIKETVPLIVNAQPMEVLQLYQAIATEKHCPLIAYDQDFTMETLSQGYEFHYHQQTVELERIGLTGEHQLRNCATAMATLLTVIPQVISTTALQQGAANTQWLGRLTPIQQGNLATKLAQSGNKWQLWIDGAHNEDGGRVLSQWLDTQSQPIYLLLGMLHDKDANGFLHHFQPSQLAGIIPLDFTAQRAAYTRTELLTLLQQHHLPIWSCPTLDQISTPIEWSTALENLLQHATGGTIVIAGSLYLIGQVLEYNA